MIEPILPAHTSRIARQKGVFLDGFHGRDLQRSLIRPIYFRQLEGECFQDPRLGITSDELLESASPLRDLAKQIKERARRPALDRGLATVTLPEPPMVGSLGASIGTNMRVAQDAIETIAVQAESARPGLWAEVRAILERQIVEARTAAFTNDRDVASRDGSIQDPNGILWALDDFDAALRALARLVQRPEDWLIRRLREHRPLPHQAAQREPRELSESVTCKTAQESIVRAAATVLVGLEHLRMVPGEQALRYFRGAEDGLAETLDHA